MMQQRNMYIKLYTHILSIIEYETLYKTKTQVSK